jgi:SAM-dependent methyltransferase
MIVKTIEYYNDNASAFYHRTINADVSSSYRQFLNYLPKQAHILDAGCGVGRDIKYFLSQECQITAFDAAKEMVALATKETGIKVIHATFQDMDFDQVFDGVWAQASLLHVPYDETLNVYKMIHRSLKPNGIFYASYKYGDGFMATKDRDFYNMDETAVKPYFKDLFEVLKIWPEKDSRGQADQNNNIMWLNFIVRKLPKKLEL